MNPHSQLKALRPVFECWQIDTYPCLDTEVFDSWNEEDERYDELEVQVCFEAFVAGFNHSISEDTVEQVSERFEKHNSRRLP